MLGLIVCLALAEANWMAPAGNGPPDPAPVATEDVLVTAERGAESRGETPAAVSILTREQIQALPAETLPELLAALPGFFPYFSHGSLQPPMLTARGFFGGGEAEYVQLLVDGVPVGDPESGLADWRSLRAADIDRIEALRGPASSLYGDTALAGVIQVFTRSAAVPTGVAGVSGGSFGSASGRLGYRGLVHGLAVSATATAARSDGYREHSAGTEKLLGLSVGHSGGSGAWALELGGSTRDLEDPGPLTSSRIEEDRRASDPLFRFDRSAVDRGRAALRYSLQTPAWSIRSATYGQLRHSDSRRTLLLAPGFGDSIQRDLRTQTVGETLEAERSLRLGGRESHLRLGLDLAGDWLQTRYRDVDDGITGAVVAAGRGSRARLGVFLSQGLEVSERLRIAASLRWDRIQDAFDSSPTRTRQAWSPRLGVNLRVGGLDRSPVSLFAQVSRAFKAPTLDQLYDPRPFPGPDGNGFVISSPTLRPQLATTVEIGASQATRAGRWEIVLYGIRVEDEIDFDPATFRYGNIGSTRHFGSEASIRLFPSAPVSPDFSYEWTRVEPTAGEHRGRQLKNVPEHVLRVGVRALLPAAVEAELRARWMGGRFADDAGRFPLPDVGVLDARIQRSFGPIRASLDVFNLTDAKYVEIGYALASQDGESVLYSFPAAGISARAGVEWTF